MPVQSDQPRNDNERYRDHTGRYVKDFNLTLSTIFEDLEFIPPRIYSAFPINFGTETVVLNHGVVVLNMDKLGQGTIRYVNATRSAECISAYTKNIIADTPECVYGKNCLVHRQIDIKHSWFEEDVRLCLAFKTFDVSVQEG